MNLLRDPLWEGISAVISIIGAIFAVVFFIVPSLRNRLQQWFNRNIRNKVIIYLFVGVFLVAIILFALIQRSISTTPQNIQVLSQGNSSSTYLLEGLGIFEHEIGDDLVVYGETIPDVEIPIALVRVTDMNPDSLKAQVILRHPDYPIRPRLRVDANIENLTKSELLPAVDIAVGYILDSGLVRLKSGIDITLGSTLIAMEPILIGAEVIDYFPYDPPIILKVTETGIQEAVAKVESVSGSWPPIGTLVILEESISQISDAGSFLPTEIDATETTQETLEKLVSLLIEKQSSPFDVMLVIDNSCSMFPSSDSRCRLAAQHNSDPDFLRIEGAAWFVNRLGFQEQFEQEFQLGTISLGETPKLLSPPQSLTTNRAKLIGSIADPVPQMATQIVPALELAYEQLELNQLSTNQPAIVLITDGFPYPIEGQSNRQMEDLVGKQTNVLLFIILLQNSAGSSTEFSNYINFWERMDSRYPHITVYTIENDDQILEAYNEIVGHLHNAVASIENTTISAGQQHNLFISTYVEKVTITIFHKSTRSIGQVEILDPTGRQVTSHQSGVSTWISEDQFIEIISIASPRLQESLKNAAWIIQSEGEIEVISDRQGEYNVFFLKPDVALTPINNVVEAINLQPPNQKLEIEFVLLDNSGEIITEPQPIQGTIKFPDGHEENLPIPLSIEPDSLGVYKIDYNFFIGDFTSFYETNDFKFILNAGLADIQNEQRIPITSSRIHITVSPLIEEQPIPYSIVGESNVFEPRVPLFEKIFNRENFEFDTLDLITFAIRAIIFLCCTSPIIIIIAVILLRRRKKRSSLTNSNESDNSADPDTIENSGQALNEDIPDKF